MIPASPLRALPMTSARVYWEHGRHAHSGRVAKLFGCHPVAGIGWWCGGGGGEWAPCGSRVGASRRMTGSQKRGLVGEGKKLVLTGLPEAQVLRCCQPLHGLFGYMS